MKEQQDQTPPLEPAAILHMLLKLSNKLMAPFSLYLERRYKISLNEFRLLMLIGKHPNMAGHELVEATGVNPMSVSRAVSALERHGRVQVTRDAANKRRKILSLTDEGRRLYAVMRPQTDRVADYLISPLSPDEQAMFLRTLDLMTIALEERDEDGNSLFLEKTRPEDPGE